MLVLITAFLAIAAISQAGNTPAPLSTQELKKIVGSNGKPTVVFFQNPFGQPCRFQKEILEKLHQNRKGNFNIVGVSTNNQSDQRAFYDYGVRSLPSLVLVDKKGKIERIFPPGIQTVETLTTALDGVK